MEITHRTREREPRHVLILLAAALSAVAALIHGWVAPEHFREWWGYGAFFAGAAVAQAAFAVALLNRPSGGLLAAGMAGNAAIITLYTMSRTTGVPVGPHAGAREAVGSLDLACTLVEAGTVAALLPLLRRTAARIASRTAVVGTLLVAAAFPSAAPAARAGREYSDPHEHAAKAVAPALASGSVVWPADDPAVVPAVEPSLPPADATPAADAGEEPQAPPCTPKLARTMPEVPAALQHNAAAAVVYADRGNLFLYDVEAGTTGPITAEGGASACWLSEPAFRNDNEIVFTAEWGRSLYRLDLTTRTLHLVAQPAGGIAAFGLSPDRNWAVTLRYQSPTGAPIIETVKLEASDTRVVKSFPDLTGAGRCGGPEDEVSVSWSPDGSRVLVVATHLVAYVPEAGEDTPVPPQPATMYVIEMDGRVVAARIATHPRWSPDSRTVYFQTFDERHAWYALDVATAKEARLGMTAGTYEIAVAPGGAQLAHAISGEQSQVYVYDVITGEEKLIAIEHAGPLWLTPESLAISKVGRCEECMDGWYQPIGVSWISASGGRARALDMSSTVDASALYG